MGSSHGCINLSTERSAWFFHFSQPGDVVEITNSIGPVLSAADGDIYDWAIPWDEWRAGSALDSAPRFPHTPRGHDDDASEEGVVVEPWQIVVLVVVVLLVLALVAFAFMRRRSRTTGARKRAEQREEARDHLREAEIRTARAEKEQALAEEQAARARRELAEVQERAALAEQEARQRAARADEDRTAAEQLRAQAQRLAPDVVSDGQQPHPEGGATRR